MMRIVIDLQGAQSTVSRNRGVGRYSLALAQGIARHRGAHEVIVALNSLFPDTIDPIRCAFSALLPRENIRIWNAPAAVSHADARNRWRRETAEHLREAFLASLDPDVILVTSLFEGFEDDAVTSIGKLKRSPPTAVVLYDLIPWIHQKPYLDNPDFRIWYEEKIQYLREAQLCLSISESSRQEGITHLHLPQDAIVNISTAADAQFECPVNIAPLSEDELKRKYGLIRSFLMYTGGIDHRKNIEGLIRAYAAVPADVRAENQLAIVCSIQPESQKALEQLAATSGLGEGELILTGFVPEEDLIALYCQCKAFIFPSWHEGFGLPALEAMHCGAAVIAANTSSLPEVIANDEALFDPFDEQAMASKIEQVLTDEAFRQRLVSYGRKQARKFSWDATAKSALKAFEVMHSQRTPVTVQPVALAQRPKLAFISPLPPERSGIATYSAELLPALAQYYDIEVVVAQAEISDAWIRANLPIRTVEWFRENASIFQRVLYHFGNSPFHEHMFNLLAEHPGVVVLHDFYLGHIQSHREFTRREPGVWVRELFHAHGFMASRSAVRVLNPEPVAFQYPCNWSAIEQATGIIVHSSHPQQLAKEWYGSRAAEHWAVIPLMRAPALSQEREKARRTLGLGSDDFVVASFGILGPTKLNRELLDAWLASELSKDKRCHLVFVGECAGEYGADLQHCIKHSGLKSRIHITGWADSDVFKNYLAASDIGVQLRARSRGETSGAVLDCLNYGLPTIVNANGSMSDLPNTAVYKLPDEFSVADLTSALESLWCDRAQRQSLSEHALSLIKTHHAPAACAKQYSEAIERAVASPRNIKTQLLQAIAHVAIPVAPTEADLLATSASVTANLGNPSGRQLLLDVSTFVHIDAKSGIQRVVRSLLASLLAASLPRIEVRPIYFDNGRYRYANRLACSVAELSLEGVHDDFVDFFDGDIYLSLDLNMHLASEMHVLHQFMQSRGVDLFFIIYDILLLQHPEWWPSEGAPMFQRWLTSISQIASGFLCISNAVAAEVRGWLQENPPQRTASGPEIFSFHLGADLRNSVPSRGLLPDAASVLATIKDSTSFLMVSTIEPRKGHAQALAAFELLWAHGAQVNLVIVGKSGWLVEELLEKLRHHPENGNRLFWLEGISDEYLEKVYDASTCLLAASLGEGFGLPLIEAAQHGIPIIARDIPVFREVAGEYAYYFNGSTPADLKDSIIEWMALYQQGIHPASENMPYLSWEESSLQLQRQLNLI